MNHRTQGKQKSTLPFLAVFKTEKMPSSEPDSSNYQQKYRNLKRKLKILIYENECFQEELKKSQRKLLKVSRDKSFLLDRLLKYENVESSSSDSEATVSSDSDNEFRAEMLTLKKKRNVPVDNEASTANSTTNNAANAEVKKKKTRKAPPAKPVIPQQQQQQQPQLPPTAAPPPPQQQQQQQQQQPPLLPQQQQQQPPPAAAPPPPTPNVKIEILPVSHDGHMTSEEIERHLEAKQSLRDLIPEKTPLTVPVELFSNDPSVMECEIMDGQVSDISTNNVVENVGIMIDIHE